MFPPKPPQGADPRMYFFLFLLTLGTTLGYQAQIPKAGSEPRGGQKK